MISVPGFQGSGISCGIKKRGKKDLALLFSETPAKAAGVFTTNIVKAPPVILGMERVKSGYCQAVLINSGIANAFTGPAGMKAAVLTSRYLAEGLGITEDLVIPSSTGLIGGPLPTDKIKKAVPQLVSELRDGGIADAAEAIMTTDAFPKYASVNVTIGGRKGTVGVIGKGAGMIMPNMATMLAYIMTDVNVGKRALSKLLTDSNGSSFNKIIVDGDTSTNDTVLLLANGRLGNRAVDGGKDYQKLLDAVTEAASEVAHLIVKDGEGATKVVKIIIKGAKTEKDAEAVARTIGTSLLVKSALFGEDPNWGRIVAAAGRAGVDFNPDRLDLFFAGHKVLSNSKAVMDEEKALEVMKTPSFSITLDLKSGKKSSFVVTSDITFDYLKINAHYRT